jgi:hypothetical protein
MQRTRLREQLPGVFSLSYSLFVRLKGLTCPRGTDNQAVAKRTETSTPVIFFSWQNRRVVADPQLRASFLDEAVDDGPRFQYSRLSSMPL